MTKEIQQILCRAISDCGYWMWWDYAEDCAQVEFGGVLLYDESKKDKEARSGHIAIRFVDKGFIVFLDNGPNEELSNDWIKQFHNDELEPFTLEPHDLMFDDIAYAEKILKDYKNKSLKGDGTIVDTIRNTKHILAGKCGGVGFILGGDEIQVYGNKGKYTREEIKDACNKWWEYWKDYWKKREKSEAYDKDYACEVTIPIEGR